jgi:glycosyltransferase involved in cell wall biosynthesis
MTNGLVSIIIPTYNRAHLIVDTLKSILSQTYTNWECLVIDDGSTDETQNVVEEFSKKDHRVQYHKRPESIVKGANSCRNYGFELTSGEYVNWFDSDDIMLADFLEKKINAFTSEIQFVIASGFDWFPNNDSKIILKIEETDNLYVDFVLWKIKILTPSVLFRKSFLQNKELFATSMKRGQEAELFARIFFECTASDYKIIHEYGFLYRQHEDSKTAKNTIYNKGYKESLLFYLFENFKRSEQVKSKELLDFFYDRLIKLFISSNENNHKKVTFFILTNFYPRLIKYDLFKAIELILVGRLMYFFKKSPQKFRNRWLKFKFKWNE